MSEDRIIPFESPVENSRDVLTEIIRRGARKLLADAVEDEVEAFVGEHSHLEDESGRRRVVRNGYLPGREVQTGIGAVPVRVPRVRDREPDHPDGKVTFGSKILPPYLRRTKSLEDLIPWLYLKGISTGDFSEALEALLGPEAPGLSASTISRLKESWLSEYEDWSRRDLSDKEYVYFWADGVYFQARLEESKQCILVVIGATADGKKELLAIQDGYRESEQSWLELLMDLKRRGLREGPRLAIGDGALGFWKALAKVFDQVRWQRCWVHKTANVLNKLPRGEQKRAKKFLHEIWMASSRREAEAAFDIFLETYGPKFPKAAECLSKDRDELLAFYDFPAEHWQHIRTTNPIESTFATVRLRTVKTKGCLSRVTALTMVFRLAESAAKKWRRLRGWKHLAEVIEGVRFVDGVRERAA
jgi:transposase-like protein